MLLAAFQTSTLAEPVQIGYDALGSNLVVIKTQGVFKGYTGDNYSSYHIEDSILHGDILLIGSGGCPLTAKIRVRIPLSLQRGGEIF